MKGVAEKMLASGDALLKKVQQGVPFKLGKSKRRSEKTANTHAAADTDPDAPDASEADQRSSRDTRHTGAGVSKIS